MVRLVQQMKMHRGIFFDPGIDRLDFKGHQAKTQPTPNAERGLLLVFLRWAAIEPSFK
jgi:hypothetical protein